MNAKNLLKELKKGSNVIDLVVVNDKGEVFARTGSLNLYSVYSYLDEEKNRKFYGVYNKRHQIDSRTHSDDEILEAIKEIKKLGKLIERNNLTFNGYVFEW